MRKMQFSASSHDKFIPLVYGVYMDHVNRFSSPFIAVKAGSSAPQLNPSANAVKAGSSAPQLNPSANGLFRIFATSSQVRLGYRFILLFVLRFFCIPSKFGNEIGLSCINKMNRRPLSFSTDLNPFPSVSLSVP